MKPSKGAVRAAKLIACSDKLRPLVFGSILRQQAAEPWAEIIEQSTHAGEMAGLLGEILNAWHDDEVSREDFCELFADKWEAQLERLLEP